MCSLLRRTKRGHIQRTTPPPSTDIAATNMLQLGCIGSGRPIVPARNIAPSHRMYPHPSPLRPTGDDAMVHVEPSAWRKMTSWFPMSPRSDHGEVDDSDGGSRFRSFWDRTVTRHISVFSGARQCYFFDSPSSLDSLSSSGLTPRISKSPWLVSRRDAWTARGPSMS